MKKKTVKEVPVETSAAEKDPIALLSGDLFMRLKQLREENDFCVVDRINSFNFVDVFKDAINSYRQDVVLCERLYFKDKCISVKRPIYNITDEMRQVYTEFIDFSEKELSGDITDNTMKKFEEYQDKLETVSPDIQEIDVLMYKSGYNGEGYMVVPLKEIPDESLKQICTMISRFIFEYFLTLKFVVANNYSISIFPVNSGDYVDITAMFKVE